MKGNKICFENSAPIGVSFKRCRKIQLVSPQLDTRASKLHTTCNRTFQTSLINKNYDYLIQASGRLLGPIS